MDNLTAIKMLREVLLGKRKTPLPQNSVQRAKTLQKTALKNIQPTAAPAQEPQPLAAAPAETNTQSPSTPAGTPLNKNVNYISDDEDEPGPLSNGYESNDNEDQDEGD